MTKLLTRAGLLAGLFAGAVLFAGGCNKAEPVAKNKDKDKDQADEKDDHKGWWCKPHGVPEEKCSLCDEEYAKKCKAKGDWCDKHDVADSHCFVCHPEYKEKFAAEYRAKYGKEPPPMKGEKVDAKDIKDRVFKVIVRMDGERPVIKIDGKEVPADKEKIFQAIETVVRTTGKKEMLLDIDKDAPWGVEADILDAAKGNKINNIINSRRASAPVAATVTTITIPDMDCEVCAEKLVKKLTAVTGVAKVDANVKAQTLTITPKEKEPPSPKALWETCVAAGYDPSKLSGPGGTFIAKPGN